MSTKTGTVLATAAMLRLALAVGFPSLPDFLTQRVEISTPLSSFQRLQEGLFLYNHNVSPYDGGVYHQPPLLLPLFSSLPDIRAYPLPTYLVYIALDLWAASALKTLGDSGEAGASRHFVSPRRAKSWTGLTLATLYLFNPYTVASCLGRSTHVFTTTLILVAMAKAVVGKPATAVVSLAFAAYLTAFPALLLPPLVLLAYDRLPVAEPATEPDKGGEVNRRGYGDRTTGAEKVSRFAAKQAALFVSSVAVLFVLSFFVNGQSWSFLARTYGIQFTLTDLTPNVGLWWYFFVEMFDSFRDFFLAVFWLHLAAYVGGLTIRLRTQPLAVLCILLGLFAIFQPYPSVSDVGLFLGVLPLYRHVFGLMRYPFVAGSTVLYATCLGPAFYHLWIYAGSGNANFFYAVTLVWSLGLSLVISDLTFAVLRDEWEVDRPDMVGQEVRQI